MTFFILSCIESMLSKIDTNMMPQQSLMELFIDGMTNTDRIFQVTVDDFDNSSSVPLAQRFMGWMGYVRKMPDLPNESARDCDGPKEIADWNGLTLNTNGYVTELYWPNYHLKGTVGWQWIPPTLQKLMLYKNSLGGCIDFMYAPIALTEIHLGVNFFSGEIFLETLPEKMEMLNLSENALCGTLNLTNLPITLVSLFLSNNSFIGKVSLGDLPSSLQELAIDFNDLSGNINVSKLPANIGILRLNNNNFKGKTNFNELPESLYELDVSCNKDLEGEIFLDDEGIEYFSDGSKVELIYGF